MESYLVDQSSKLLSAIPQEVGRKDGDGDHGHLEYGASSCDQDVEGEDIDDDGSQD